MDPTAALTAAPATALEEIQQRLLWLATRIVDHANRERPNPDVGIKVGGHQASSASMVTLMTALWFGTLQAPDRVSVKPHASPVLHAIHYLLGGLDRRYLTTLRELGGLQSYPSRTKDPYPVDFCTGSVGLGAVAPLFAAATRRYVDAHFGEQPRSRFIALLGDAELDEGNVWEAVAEPSVLGLGNVMWVVDLNRQSLDRVVPGIRAGQLQRMFADSGWHVVEVKYGRRLQAAFAGPHGDALRRHVDEMPNEQYQPLLGGGPMVRDRFLAGADPAVKQAVRDLSDDELPGLLADLGGHDLAEVLAGYRAADGVTDRPSVVFAYTIKGWRLPMAGDPQNHSRLLTGDEIAAVRASAGLGPEDEWDRLPADSPGGRWCAQVASRLAERPAREARHAVRVPGEVRLRPTKPVSTQQAFGQLLTRLSRHDETAERVVTTAPDVATSTNLAGWIGKAGVFSPELRPEWSPGTTAAWREDPQGQHIELGISEMNLFSLLGQLGLADVHHGQTLLPIGTVYDPFVCRGLDALIYALYSGARFVVVGTPSGVTLSREGGAHQSTVTASLGIELPGLTAAEPAYVGALDWLLCDGLRAVADPIGGEAMYLRLTTRPLDQSPFEAARQRLGDEVLRSDVLAGGYVLRELAADPDPTSPLVNLVAMGALVPEALGAADVLADEGVSVRVIDVTSADRLYRGWQQSLRRGVRAARVVGPDFHLARLLPPPHRSAPMVSVHDAASHGLAWVGSVFGTPVVPLGVDEFGQTGSLQDLYRAHDLSVGHIVNAALVALARHGGQ